MPSPWTPYPMLTSQEHSSTLIIRICSHHQMHQYSWHLCMQRVCPIIVWGCGNSWLRSLAVLQTCLGNTNWPLYLDGWYWLIYISTPKLSTSHMENCPSNNTKVIKYKFCLCRKFASHHPWQNGVRILVEQIDRSLLEPLIMVPSLLRCH